MLPDLVVYSPTEDIMLEHGHRYDFMNCPEPLVNDGHILPPGFFISRLYAQGYMTKDHHIKVVYKQMKVLNLI